MKNLSFLLLLCCTVLTAISQNQKWFTLKAFLPQWNNAEISLFQNNQLLYTGKVVKDLFDFTGNIAAPMPGTLKVKQGKTIFFIPVFYEPGTIKIRDAGNRSMVAYGTPSNDTYNELNKNFDSLIAKNKAVNFSQAIDYKREQAAAFIRNNSNSVVSVQLLKDYFFLSREASDTQYYSLVHSLDTGLQQFYFVKEMMGESAARYITAIGRTAPLMELADSCGRTRPIYAGASYTLLDFWASWCVPCRKENPALLQVYKKYTVAGFSITGISLDVNKTLWLKAIKRDKLLWPQLSELKGWESSSAKVYGVKVIPMNYLIDGQGVIIARNLQPGQLDMLLASLLKQ